MQNSGIKNKEHYETLIHKVLSNEKYGQTANSSNAGENVRTKPYEEWTKEELYQQARKVGVEGRSYMNKRNLIKSLRNN
ncbi:Rho termination factor [Flavobacterium sp. MEB061]|uniref:hypothetical protein n=1 Tax=Flavobacterium sp. MEB061 TaxID=1587524 RepID=UPI0005ACE078|nr:hypothetical protein [Flavobacterium sp. MEB061]KIQ22368.1 Rho termination factor [Flavobacterium sp. MEB061]